MPETPAERRFASISRTLVREEGVALGSGQRGFGSGALQVDGRIFAMVTGGGLVLKLPKQRVDELVAKGDGVPFDGGKGRPMKEWVELAPGADRRSLSLAREALAFVGHR
jgi:TfoX/Sxy family transcriptional regulator of competence genes